MRRTKLEMFKVQAEIAKQAYDEQVDARIDLERKNASKKRIAYQNRRVQKRFDVWFDFCDQIEALEAKQATR